MPIALRVSIARLMTIARDQVSRADPLTVTVIQQAVPHSSQDVICSTAFN
jgi:hypothetical protein